MANVVTMFGRSTRTETTTTAAKTSTLSSTGAFANGFRAFAGSQTFPPANETPVEALDRRKARPAVVTRGATTRVEVQEMERKARHPVLLEELRRERGAQAQTVKASEVSACNAGMVRSF